MDVLTAESDMPANARRLWIAAEKAGWRIFATRATGEWKDKPVESVVIRLARNYPTEGIERLAASWEHIDGKWSFRAAWRQRPFALLNSRELTQAVTS